MAVEHRMDFGIKQRFTIIWRKAILKSKTEEIFIFFLSLSLIKKCAF